MEPNNQPIMPPTEPVLTPIPPQKGMWNRKKILVIGGGLVLLVIIGIVVTNLLAPKKPQTPADPSKAADLYIKRAGYDNTTGIGDATALKQVSTNKVISYGGANVVQACSMATVQAINDSGMKLEARQDAQGIKRTYFDGNGAGSIVLDTDTALPFEEDTNSCTYYLQSSKANDYVSVSVYQSAYVNMGAVDSELSRSYTAQASMHGLQVYAQKKESPTDPLLADVDVYIFRSSNAAMQVTLATADKDAKAKLLDKIAANMAAAQTTPTPLDRFELQSPIFNGTALESCSLIDNSAFRTVFNSDASPLVQERTGTAIGIVQHQPDPKKPANYYNYTSSDCTRYEPARTYLYANRITATTLTYETVAGAKDEYTFTHEQSPFTSGANATPVTVGDESFYGSVAGSDHSITFRKGRVVVSVSYDLGKDNNSVSDAQRMQALMPLAQQVVAKLKGY